VGIPDLDQDRMVSEQIERRGVRDPRVLQALRTVPRHAFVPDHLSVGALQDRALPIGYRQTISQPYIVGKMTELLEIDPTHTVLEVGTGSGYQTAILSVLARRVFSLEIVPELADSARERLDLLGFDNVSVVTADGTSGLVASGPFDRICVTAAPQMIPQALKEQLNTDGRMVLPLGDDDQYLWVVERRSDQFFEEKSIGVRFVPMTGKSPIN
jgi:protein-L-isoaspartate(D-aspartate) O-methyltransferase